MINHIFIEHILSLMYFFNSNKRIWKFDWKKIRVRFTLQ